MFKKVIALLKHKHEYTKVGFREVDNGYVRYSIRTYQCKTCGKEIEVDGRFDNMG
ncbi:hypothetical protein ACFYKX_11100 [Cytobacillus sp. FJAT-54145]|uniref:Transposase n=1 Tax=Cytobacillus spartinae TaxID=3299023 RepID=A0ABW6KAF5_9BACI